MASASSTPLHSGSAGYSSTGAAGGGGFFPSGSPIPLPSVALPSALDKPISRGTTQVSLSSFAYLFSEMVQYCRQTDLEKRLFDMGYGIGLRALELITWRTSVQHYLLSNAQAGSADAAARTMAMHSSMRQALHALSSGELEALSVAPAAAASAAAHATSAASSSGLRPAGSSVAAWRAAGGVQPGRPEPALPSLLSDADAEEDRKDDSGDDSKEESAETLRARRAASAQRDAAKRKQLQAQRQTPQSVGSAAALDSDAAGDVVKEGSLSMPAVSVATQRRALLLSLIGGLLVLLVLGWMLLPAMEDALFTPVRTGGRGATRHSGVPLTAASSEAHRAAAQAARNTAAQQ